jgi:ABC-type sugar transport system ATPase subunit
MDSDATIPNDASAATNTEIGFHTTNGDEDEAIIRAIKLNKFFGDKHVLKDIDFEVRKQEVVALIGPSGSGKSTLIRCLNALEKLTSGEIYIHGQKLNPFLSIKQLSPVRRGTAPLTGEGT